MTSMTSVTSQFQLPPFRIPFNSKISPVFPKEVQQSKLQRVARGLNQASDTCAAVGEGPGNSRNDTTQKVARGAYRLLTGQVPVQEALQERTANEPK